MIDLDGYFARIGYRGPRAPTRETLDGIVRAHVEAIPFENLDILLGRPIEVAPAAIERKLVGARRGGYCFEHNGLLLEVLTQLGYTARPLGARVRYQRTRDYIPARTHMFVRVELDSSHLVDVGFGALSLTSAIRLVTDEPQPTPHETRRLIREGGLWFHQVLFGDEWQDLYEFTLEEMPMIDREVANWYTSTHPASNFRSRLWIARALADGGRLSLLNRELRVRRRDGTADVRALDTPDELLSVLAERFGLVFAPGTRFSCDALDWPAPE